MKNTIAIYVLTQNGLNIADKIQQQIPNTVPFISAKLSQNISKNTFTSLPSCIENNFTLFSAHIFVCALGIVSRVIAPQIQNKREDPAILCIDEQGSFVISVLSGHRGGANQLTDQIATTLSAIPVITTASDVSQTLSVDTFGEIFGWCLEPCCEEAITPVASAIVNNKKVAIYQDPTSNIPSSWKSKVQIKENIHFIADISQAEIEHYDGIVTISHNTESMINPNIKNVIWRPNNLVLGIGCDKNTPIETLEEGLNLFCDTYQLSIFSIRALASIDLKKDELGIHQLKEKLNCPFYTFRPDQLDNVEGIEHPSEYVKKITGSNSVAEAAALVESNSNKLLIPKWKYKARGYNMTLTCCIDQKHNAYL